jgi:hypothetical protein
MALKQACKRGRVKQGIRSLSVFFLPKGHGNDARDRREEHEACRGLFAAAQGLGGLQERVLDLQQECVMGMAASCASEYTALSPTWHYQPTHLCALRECVAEFAERIEQDFHGDCPRIIILVHRKLGLSSGTASRHVVAEGDINRSCVLLAQLLELFAARLGLGLELGDVGFDGREDAVCALVGGLGNLIVALDLQKCDLVQCCYVVRPSVPPMHNPTHAPRRHRRPCASSARSRAPRAADALRSLPA